MSKGSGLVSESEPICRNKSNIARADVWAVDLEPVKGREMGKKRPCVVITNNVANQYSSVVTVVAITSKAPKKAYPFMVRIPKTANMPKDSWVNCVYVRTVDKSRLKQYITSLDLATMAQVSNALRDQLGMN